MSLVFRRRAGLLAGLAATLAASNVQAQGLSVESAYGLASSFVRERGRIPAAGIETRVVRAVYVIETKAGLVDPELPFQRVGFTRVPMVGSQAPDFTLKDLKGQNVSLSQFKGKVVLLDFWASWCPPCQASTPFLVEMHKKYGSKGLVVLSINRKEDPATVEAYVKKHGIENPVLLDDADAAKNLYPSQGIPTFVLIGRDGKILWKQIGYGDELRELFEKKIVEAFSAGTI